MISSLTWIPRGAARSRPVRYELSAEEYTRIKAMAAIEKQEEDEAENKKERKTNAKATKSSTGEESEDDEDKEDYELPPEFDMDNYDDDDNIDGDDEPNEEEMEKFAMLEQGDMAFAMEAESDDEDAEDDEIHPGDALLVVAMTEDEFSHLEVQLLAEDGNMFVHHDIQLPEFPLCLAWLDCPPFRSQGEQQAVGNYVAVGSFNPAIEIWNLDVLDPLEPSAVLGGEEEELSTKRSKKGKKGTKSQAKGRYLKDDSHEDAVMSLSWNRVYRQALASGSADTTVKIWDVTTQKCSHTFTHHSDKVQSVVFHPEEAWQLATGSFDKTIALLDCRTGLATASYSVPADMESMVWDPFQPHHLYAALENGDIVCIDVRNKALPLFNFQAHSETVSSISFSASVPGYLCTASEDKTVKVWDVARCQSGESKQPEEIGYKTMNVGKLFALQFFPDNPFLLATGGDSGMVAVWESDEMDAIQQRFGGRVQPRENAYLSLATAAGGYNGSADVSNSFSADAVMPPPDDSWMDEPDAAASTKNVGTSKGDKKKKKSKVSKSSI